MAHWSNYLPSFLQGQGKKNLVALDSGDSFNRVRQSRFGDRSITQYGGVRNHLSGMGGPSDKGDTTFFRPTNIANKFQLETIHNESWAAGKFVDLPIDDMFIRWRKWHTPDKGLRKAIKDIEKNFETQMNLGDAMKAARLFGSGILVIVTENTDMTSPLKFDTMKSNDLANILVYDRYDCQVDEFGKDPYDIAFNKPLYYRITNTRISEMLVHHSRVLRFDGRRPLTTNGFSNFYDRHWGLSELIPAMSTIIQEAATAAGAAHLVQESSIAVIKSQGFKNANMGNADIDDPDAEIIGSNLNDQKSIYRMMFLDLTEEFERVNVSLAGVPELMDRNFQHLAAVAGIPATRFLGTPPVGFDATGDSDMANYAIHVQSMQERLLEPRLRILDMVLARNLGLKELPEYEWQSLIDLSRETQEKNRHMKIDSLKLAIESTMFSPEEGRNVLVETDEEFSSIEALPVNPGEHLEQARMMADVELENAMANGDSQSTDEEVDDVDTA